MSFEKGFIIGSKLALAAGLVMGGIALESGLAADRADRQGEVALADDLENRSLEFGALAVSEFGASLGMCAGAVAMKKTRATN